MEHTLFDIAASGNVVYFWENMAWLGNRIIMLVLLGLIVFSGLSAKLWQISTTYSKIYPIQVAVYTFLFTLLAISTFPFELLHRYWIAKISGASHPSLIATLKLLMINTFAPLPLVIILVLILYFLLKKTSHHWWAYFSIVCVFFTIIFYAIYPSFIAPRIAQSRPLENQVLKEKILTLGKNIGYEKIVIKTVKKPHVYAAVFGVYKTPILILSDHTLSTLSEKELLFVIAHEIGHHHYKHNYLRIMSLSVMLLLSFFLSHIGITYILSRFSEKIQISSMSQVSSFPLLLLLCYIGILCIEPVQLANIRWQETQADKFALTITQDLTSGVSFFKKLEKTHPRQVNPDIIYRIFRAMHPSIQSRINTLNTYANQIGLTEPHE